MNVQTSKGSIHYEVHGEGHPIVILHALAMDHRAMQAWIEPIFNTRSLELANYRRIYIDLPAHGQSEIHEAITTSDELLASILDTDHARTARFCLRLPRSVCEGREIPPLYFYHP